MQKITKKAILFSSMGLLIACGNSKKMINTMKETTKAIDKGINISDMDTNVRPQDDFYNYVNGGWAKTAQIPADKPSWGAFQILREKTDENSLLILDNLLKENYPKGSEGQKIKDLYQSFIDWNQRNKEGFSPIQSNLNQIDAIKNDIDNIQNKAESVYEASKAIKRLKRLNHVQMLIKNQCCDFQILEQAKLNFEK